MAVFLAVTTFACLFLSVSALLQPPSDKRPPRTLWVACLRAAGTPLSPWLSEGRRPQTSSRLALANLTEQLNAREYAAARVAMTVFGWLAGAALASWLSGNPSATIVFALLGALLGWTTVTVWLWQRSRRRADCLAREFPLLLSLLAMAERAGCDLTTGLKRAHAHLGGTALRAEVAQLLHQVQLGCPVEAALQELADTTGMEGVHGLASAALQTRKVGGEVGPWLEILAEQCWNDWVSKRRAAVLRLPVLLVLPMVLFLLPALAIVILGPASIAGMQAMKQSGIF